MLSPVSYKRDLERVFGRVLNHSPKSKGLDDLTHAMWNKMWPDEPFEPNEFSLDTTYKSQFDYDIISAVQRQKLFFYQVSLPHFKDLTFLQEGLQRYKMYLYLKSLYPEEFLVPCYDMDIFWHTHQVNPVEYEEQTRAIVGHHLPHDDSVNDRAPGSKLCNSEENTINKWRITFNCDFKRNGAMFRGDPPKGKLWTIPNEFDKTFVTGATYLMDLNHPEVEWILENSNSVQKYTTKGELTLKTQYKIEKWDYYGLRQEVKKLSDLNIKDHSENSVKFDANSSKNVGYTNSSILQGVHSDAECLNSQEQIDLSDLISDLTWSHKDKIEVHENTNIKPLFQIVHHEEGTSCCFCTLGINLCNKDKKWNWNANAIVLSGGELGKVNEETLSWFRFTGLVGTNNNNTTLNASVSIKRLADQPVWKKLTIDPGSFYDCIIPEHIEALWGPVPLKRLPEGVDNECKAVTHNIMDGPRKAVTVYMIHSLPLEMSAIQVFVQEKMAVVAHLVDAATIGNYWNYPHSPIGDKDPWRAMIIKDEIGDWGICVAGWIGMRPGKPGIRGTRNRRGVRGIPGDPGRFEMIFISLRNSCIHTVTLPKYKEYGLLNYSFGISESEDYNKKNKMYVDLEKGDLVLSPHIEDSLQHITLAFVTSMLYLMVKPLPTSDANVPAHILASYQKESQIQFFQYCGWNIRKHIPTNSTFRHICGYGAVAGCVSGGNNGGDNNGGGCGGCGGGGGGCGGCGGCGGKFIRLIIYISNYKNILYVFRMWWRWR